MPKTTSPKQQSAPVLAFRNPKPRLTSGRLQVFHALCALPPSMFSPFAHLILSAARAADSSHAKPRKVNIAKPVVTLGGDGEGA